MKRYKKWIVLLSVIAIAVSSLRFKENYFEISKNLEIFTSLFRDLNIYYVDETNPGDMMKTAVDAMLNSLDPYTTYIPESKIEDYRFQTTGQYGGIGALIRSVDGEVYISEPYEGFPAQEAGLKAGDRIISIDGRNVKDRDQEEISELLKGQSGTTLDVKIERQGEEMIKTLTRADVKIPDVPYHGMLDEQTGYVKLRSFTSTASRDVGRAIDSLKEQHDMKKLVLDLRGNGGGLLNEAVNITNFFVPKGTEVVSTKGKISDWDKTHVALNEPMDTDMPVVVLVDEGSASASEIVSGALQDLDRAVIIGRTTYGKGLVQQTRSLDYNSKLKLTVAKYYIPSGRCIQKLDYSHRSQDGTVEEVPDSLLETFTTKGGREVIDGRGIEPDVTIDEHDYPPILSSLLSENLFFRYANEYQYEHESIAPPEEFDVDSELYSNFRKFLSDKHYSYTTRTENEYNELVETAREEQYYGLAEEKFRELQDQIESHKGNDLELFRDDISRLLENELVSRYYYQTGRIRATLADDPFISEALNVLNSDKYGGILSGEVESYTIEEE